MSALFSTQIAQLKAGASFRKVLIDIARSGEVGLRIVKTAALDFAERTLPYYEAKFPGDLRPRTAIDVARRYLRGEATFEELKAAAADDAADDADDAAWAAADAAADAATWAAEAAAQDAADDAADDATWAVYAARAAWATAAGERAWQRDHLIQLLEAAE